MGTLAILNCFMLEVTSSHPYGLRQSNSFIMKARNQAKKLFFIYYERKNMTTIAAAAEIPSSHVA